MRVVRMRYSGREKSVMHQHPPGIGVFLPDPGFKFSYPDGKTENIQARAGSTQEQSHSTSATSSCEAKWMIPNFLRIGCRLP